MLIKLRACTAQSLVLIIFAEFYDDSFLPTNYQPASPRKGESTAMGPEDACWLPVCCVLAQPEPWRRGSCAEEQMQDRPRRVGAAEHESVFRAKLWET